MAYILITKLYKILFILCYYCIEGAGNMDKKKVWSFCTIGAIILFALILRIFYIDINFWYDEACSWFTAKQVFPFGILDNLFHLDLQHTPIYFFLLHFWMNIFGDSEIAIRSLSCIFGVGCIPLAYVIANKLFDNFQAKFAAVLVAVSPILVFFSVEARMYPVVCFFVLLSLNFLIDFEFQDDNKSLIKLAVVNLLIPYTLVGGILYNLSIWICYGRYLFKNKKEKFFTYIKELSAELILLIPYFVMLVYYGRMRSLFVVKHEGSFAFWHFVEVLRNFFGATIVDNPYWPTISSYEMTVGLVILVIVPCCYFVYGFIQGLLHSKGFLKSLYYIVVVSFCFSLICSMLEINVFTIRYIIYLVAPAFILSLYGLNKRLSCKHLCCFLAFFTICSVVFDFRYSYRSRNLREKAMHAVKQETEVLNFTNEDMVIMPFGSDAPYYFRKINTPRVVNFDFHKLVRDPYNSNFYDAQQMKIMAGDKKYKAIYNSVLEDRCFSESFVNYFVKNVNFTVNPGRFVLLALYGEDANALVQLSDIRRIVEGPEGPKIPSGNAFLMKYLFDMRFLLDQDFDFVKSYKKDNYTYLLYKKR